MINIKEIEQEYSTYEKLFAEKPVLEFLDNNPLPLDKDKFLHFLTLCGERNEDTEYCESVQSMCEFFIYWAYLELKDSKFDIKYVAGNFGFFEHHWLEYNDIIIDFTLKQFNPSYPDTAILSKNKAYHQLLYNSAYDSGITEWVNNLLDRAYAGEDVSKVDEFDEIMNIEVTDNFDNWMKQLDNSVVDYNI